MRIAIVGGTGRLGSNIIKNVMKRDDVSLQYAVARKGNQYVGQSMSSVAGG